MKYTIPLKKNYEFVRTYKHGQFKSAKYLTIYIRKNGKEFNRVGVTQVKKFGNSVQRNRAKRLARESYRACEAFVEKGYDIVIMSRKTEDSPAFFDIRKDLMYLLKKTAIVTEKENNETNIIVSD